MTANTPRGYTYPLLTDPADFPTQIQDFAQDVDTDVQAQVTATAAALNAPSARASHSLNQAINPSTFTFVTFNTEEYDNAAMVNLGVNNDRITFTSTGIYLVEAQVNFAPNGNAVVGGRKGAIVQNLSGVSEAHNTIPGIQTFATELSITSLINVVTIGDFVRLRVIHDSGAALNVDARSISATKVSSL
jgi:hypothetical protein